MTVSAGFAVECRSGRSGNRQAIQCEGALPMVPLCALTKFVGSSADG